MAQQSLDSLIQSLERFSVQYSDLQKQENLAIAVSGGPDSMALASAISEYYADVKCHFVTVDHGLREEAKQEAQMVADWVQAHGNKRHTHVTLKWEGEKPENAILERAREERYKLIADYCLEHKIAYLFVGHHMDDQVETFLIRLAKGSGLDGLAAMQDLRAYNNLKIVRPFLEITKQTLVNYCQDKNIPFVNDPTNEKGDYLRPRLRQSMKVLEEEGLTTKRISSLSRRLARARNALEQITAEQKQFILLKQDNADIRLDWNKFNDLPDEIAFRLLGGAIEEFRPDQAYHVRMEKLEDLFLALKVENNNFKPRTLGGSIIKVNKNELIIQKEK